MTPIERRAEINMSGIPVSGIGGLGLVAISLVMTVVLPEAWWLLVLGVSGGVVLAVAIVLARRHHVPSGPSGDDPAILCRPEPVKGATHSPAAGERKADRHAPGAPVSLPIGALAILSTPVQDRS